MQFLRGVMAPLVNVCQAIRWGETMLFKSAVMAVLWRKRTFQSAACLQMQTSLQVSSHVTPGIMNRKCTVPVYLVWYSVHFILLIYLFILLLISSWKFHNDEVVKWLIPPVPCTAPTSNPLGTSKVWENTISLNIHMGVLHNKFAPSSLLAPQTLSLFWVTSDEPTAWEPQLLWDISSCHAKLYL